MYTLRRPILNKVLLDMGPLLEDEELKQVKKTGLVLAKATEPDQYGVVHYQEAKEKDMTHQEHLVDKGVILDWSVGAADMLYPEANIGDTVGIARAVGKLVRDRNDNRLYKTVEYSEIQWIEKEYETKEERDKAGAIKYIPQLGDQK